MAATKLVFSSARALALHHRGHLCIAAALQQLTIGCWQPGPSGCVSNTDRLDSGHLAGIARQIASLHAAGGRQQQNCWFQPTYQRHLACQAWPADNHTQPAPSLFQVMGYGQPTYDVDLAALDKRYKQLQWHLHPDRSAGKPQDQQHQDAELSMLVNQAYQVLRNPLARANYMLKLAGITHEESEGTIENSELLMEVMEAREQVEHEQEKETLRQLQASNKQRQSVLYQQISQAFNGGDISLAQQLVAQLSYWVRLEEAIHEKL